MKRLDIATLMIASAAVLLAGAILGTKLALLTE